MTVLQGLVTQLASTLAAPPIDTVYPLTALPPSSDGGAHAIVTCPSAGVAVTDPGAPGRPCVDVAAEALEGALTSPAAFTATTVNVTLAPSGSPEKEAEVCVAGTSTGAPPRLDETRYAASGEVPSKA